MKNYEERNAAKAARVALLTAANPALVNKGPDCAAAAKNIRTELKAAFPAVKFSVKTSRYSGGNSIDIRWTDGPMSAQVDEITGKYAHGSFSGMDDSYNFSDSAWNDAFGGAYYVFTNRNYSDAAVAGVIRTLRAKHPDIIADIEAKTEVTVEAYNNGNLRSVQAPWLFGQEDLASAIGMELQRRTWALTKDKIAKFAIAVEETAA